MDLPRWLFPSLILSLRIAPTFAFAPPFTLVPVPALFRVLLAVGLTASLAAVDPPAAMIGAAGLPDLASVALRELMIGLVFVLVLQATFAALYTAGRTVDIQAGYGLALLIDPSSRNQTPLLGSLFVYCAGAVFFAMNGPGELLGILAASLRSIPIGAAWTPSALTRLAEFMSAIFALGFGAVGSMILCLFLTDMAIAMMSRTIPQMNVLVLGLQAKTLITLAVLPAVLGGSGALLARMMRLALQTIPRLLSA